MTSANVSARGPSRSTPPAPAVPPARPARRPPAPASRRQRVGDLHQIRRALALEGVDRLLDFERVAARAAKRPVHRRDERHRRAAVLRAQADHRPRELERPASSSGRNAPLPVFTSSTSPLSPSASFLLMMLAAISGIDSTVAVASRSAYSLLVGRRDLRRLPDQGAAEPLDLRARLGRAKDRCGSRGSIRACRACRRCGPGLGRTSSARRRRSDATSGASTSETLSPTPPVECLSTTGDRVARRSEPVARGDHGVGQRRRLVRDRDREEARHQERGHLIVGHRDQPCIPR